MINSLKFQKPRELKRNILLSPDKKILYFSIPKCACSTVKVFLRTLYGQDPDEAWQNPHSIENSSLLNYSDLDGDQELNQLIEDESVFKFSIIRDPRSRVYSAYIDKFVNAPKDVQKIFLKQLGSIEDKYLEGTENISFEYFLRLISQQSPLQMNAHWRPMTNQILGLSPNQINLYNLSEVSHALKDVESFSDVTNIYTRIDLNFSPHATKASNASFAISKEMISLIVNTYKDDLYLYLYREVFSLV